METSKIKSQIQQMPNLLLWFQLILPTNIDKFKYILIRRYFTTVFSKDGTFWFWLPNFPLHYFHRP